MFAFSIGADVLDLDAPAGRDLQPAWGRGVSAGAVLTWLGGMALLVFSAGWVRGPVKWPRSTWPIAAALAATVMIGSLTAGLIAAVAALWIGGVLGFVAGAIRFLALARRERFMGALLMGLALSTVPIHGVLARVFELVGLTLPNRVEVWIFAYAILALGMHLLVFEDVTYELRQQNASLHDAHEELKAKAITDPLTGCYNRRFFDEIAGRELLRHQRFGLPLSIVFFDCDRFKVINDRHGHDAGDRVLELVGRLLRGHIRQTDYAFRWGGDEFVLLVTCDEARAAVKAAEIQAAFAAEPMQRGFAEGTALSAGWVTVPRDATALLPFVNEADERMYAARRLAVQQVLGA
jgi:diguanylate cyclase (GGDEF)-like protein